MCIICNVTIGTVDESYDNISKAEEFLNKFAIAQRFMRLAANKLLQVSEIKGLDAASRDRYDAVHKNMVRLSREWNKLEEKREASHA